MPFLFSLCVGIFSWHTCIKRQCTAGAGHIPAIITVCWGLSPIPALFLLAILAIGDDILFNQMALGSVPEDVKADKAYKEIIVLAQITNVVRGINFGDQPEWVYAAAEAWTGWQATSTTLKTASVPALSLISGFLAYRMLNPSFRSRNASRGY